MRSVFGKIFSGVALFAVSLGVAAKGHAAERAALTARAAATQTVEFDVFLLVEHRDDLEKLLVSLHNSKSAQFHKWLKPAEFNARFGVSPDKLSAIQSELTSQGMTVSQAGPRQLHVRGSAKRVEGMFQSELMNGSFANGQKTVAFSKTFVLPSSISAADGVVTGLSGRIRMQTHSAVTAVDPKMANPDNRYGTTGPYWFTDLKQAYSFPSYLAYDGTGATLGVLISGDYRAADMTSYFGHEKLAAPSVIEFKINGGSSYASGGSFEAALDLQQSGGMAPNAQLVLVNIPSLSDSNILSGLVTVVENDLVDVLNMSFGGAERYYSAELNDGQDFSGILRAYDDLFAQGNAQGITFVASSGDEGALALAPIACLGPTAKPGCGTMQVSAEFPASSPHVTAVGGTNLLTGYSPSAPLNSPYRSENAEDDPLIMGLHSPASGAVWGSGGGESYFFTKPEYQTLVNTGTKFRAVPDVSLHMGGCPAGTVSPCPPTRSADVLAFNGHYYGVIGTSASAPDFMGLLGLKIQRDQSRQGNVNYELYLDSAEQSLGILQGVFRKNIEGYNGYYSTKPGYDKVTGLGSIRGLNFLQAPAGTGVAGTPQTPTNP